MDELSTQPIPQPKRTLILVIVGIAILVAIAAAVAMWFYHPYFKTQRMVQEGEERRAILNTLPENPRAKDLTFEERQSLLSGLEAN